MFRSTIRPEVIRLSMRLANQPELWANYFVQFGMAGLTEEIWAASSLGLQINFRTGCLRMEHKGEALMFFLTKKELGLIRREAAKLLMAELDRRVDPILESA